MAVLTIPFPSQGGTVTLTPDTVAWTHLGDNRFMVIYKQDTPSYHLAQIVTYNGLSAPTLGPACHIRANYLTGHYRVFKVSADKAVVFWINPTSGIEYQFLTFDASGTIVPSPVSTTKPVTTTVYVYIDGNTIDLTQITDTIFSLSYYADGHYFYGAHNLTVDPSAETVTKSTVSGQSYNFSNGSYDVTTGNLATRRIPGTEDFLQTFGYKYSTNNYHYFRILSPTGVTLAMVNSAFSHAVFDVNYVHLLHPLSASRFVAVRVIGTTEFIAAAPSPAAFSSLFRVTTNLLTNAYDYAVNNVIPLDGDHFLVVAPGDSTIAAMVFRFLAAEMADCSVPTDIPGGLLLDLGGITGGMQHFGSFNQFHRVRQPAWHKMDDGTILFWFIWNNQLCYTVIHQPLT